MKFLHAAAMLCGLAMCACSGLTLAQTVSPPIPIATAETENVYIYNPPTGTILSPVEYTNELTMVPWRSFNSTMQWNINSTGNTFAISAAYPRFAGCGYGSSAVLNVAAQGLPVTTVCTSAAVAATISSVATTFGTSTGAKATNFIISIYTDNIIGDCMQIVSGVPTAQTCSPSTGSQQWQLVTIG